MTRVRKAIFPAAGLGTRFLPVTKAQPKEMLPLVDKPTIQYGVEEAIASGIMGDAVIVGGEPCLKQLIDAHRATGATVIAVRRFPRSEIGRYGVVVTGGAKGRIHEVTDMVEKPEPGTEPSDLAILGRYILTPAVFDELDRAEQ